MTWTVENTKISLVRIDDSTIQASLFKKDQLVCYLTGHPYMELASCDLLGLSDGDKIDTEWVHQFLVDSLTAPVNVKAYP